MNKILHREFVIKEINNNDGLLLTAEYSFNSFFENLGLFLENTIYEKSIQNLISQAIIDYSEDKDLSDELKYEKGKIFIDNNGKFEPISKKQDIMAIFNALKDIEINGKKFGVLCKEKKWKDDNEEFIPKKQFYNSRIAKNNLDNNNGNNKENQMEEEEVKYQEENYEHNKKEKEEEKREKRDNMDKNNNNDENSNA